MFWTVLVLLASTAGCAPFCPSCPTSDVDQCAPCNGTDAVGGFEDTISGDIDDGKGFVDGFSNGSIRTAPFSFVTREIIDTGLGPILGISAITGFGIYFTTAKGLFRLNGSEITPVFRDSCTDGAGFSGLDYNPTDCKLYFGNPRQSRIERFDPRDPETREAFVTTNSAPGVISVDRCRQRIFYIGDGGDLQAVDISTKAEDSLPTFLNSYIDVEVGYNSIYVALSDLSDSHLYNLDGVFQQLANFGPYMSLAGGCIF